MAMSVNNQANEKYRTELTEKLMEYFKSEQGGGEWVVQVANNAFGFPFVNENGSDEVVKITISIPNGDRAGNPYDLDAEGEDFKRNQAKKAEIKAKQEQAKAKKIEADRKKREAMAKLKAKQEQGAE